MQPKISPPIINLRSESEASHLITRGADIPIDAHLIGEIEVRSKEQPHMSLGNYSPADLPKGYAVLVNPDSNQEAIVTQITNLGTNDGCELVLHIANYGSETVSVEVWQI